MTRLNTVLLLSLLVCVAFRIWIWRETNVTLEDALITFRYVEQLTAGEGFVYNISQRVQGTTSPLWTLLLATTTTTFKSNVITTSKVIGILLDAATLTLMMTILWRLSIPLAALFAIFFVSSPTIAPISVSGMETPLVLFSMTLAFWGFVKRNNAFGVGMGVLLLTRIDGFIFVVAVIAASFFHERRWTLKQFVIAILLCAPWFLFAQLYFASMIPQSALAKSAVYNVDVATTVKPLLNHFTPFIEQTVPRFAIKSLLFIALVVGALTTMKRQRLFRPLTYFFIAYCLALTFSGVLIFSWYMVPAVFASSILIALGTIAIVNATLTRRVHLQPYFTFAIAASLLVMQISLLNGRIQQLRELQDFEDNVRKQMGLWLKNNVATGSTVVLEPLGYVGYYAGRDITMIDEIGLVSPDVVRDRTTRNDWYVHTLATLKPDYVVQYAYTLDHNVSEGTETQLFTSPTERQWFDDTFHAAVTFDVSDQYPRLQAKEKKYVIFRRR